MLRSITRPAIYYDLVGLATDGLVTVGRESESHIRLDSPEVPFLLSRKHGTLQFQPDGNILLKDLDSTNGTYTARGSQPLHRMVRGSVWELKAGDTIGFGGPETIIVDREHVGNPFKFKFYPLDDEEEETPGQQEGVRAVSNINHAHPIRAVAADGVAVAGTAAVSAGLQDMAALATFRATPQECLPGANRPGNSCKAHYNLRPARHARSACAGASAGTAVVLPAPGKENNALALQPPHTPTGSKMTEILHNHFTCPICQEWLLACHTLSCGHMFCGLCLATWLSQKPSCPSCRKAVAGIPVRCFQVDNTINDLLGINIMSPSTKHERKRKQAHWEDIQSTVVHDWALNINQRKQQAISAASRHHRNLMGANSQVVVGTAPGVVAGSAGSQPGGTNLLPVSNEPVANQGSHQ